MNLTITDASYLFLWMTPLKFVISILNVGNLVAAFYFVYLHWMAPSTLYAIVNEEIQYILLSIKKICGSTTERSSIAPISYPRQKLMFFSTSVFALISLLAFALQHILQYTLGYPRKSQLVESFNVSFASFFLAITLLALSTLERYQRLTLVLEHTWTFTILRICKFCILWVGLTSCIIGAIPSSETPEWSVFIPAIFSISVALMECVLNLQMIRMTLVSEQSSSPKTSGALSRGLSPSTFSIASKAQGLSSKFHHLTTSSLASIIRIPSLDRQKSSFAVNDPSSPPALSQSNTLLKTLFKSRMNQQSTPSMEPSVKQLKCENEQIKSHGQLPILVQPQWKRVNASQDKTTDKPTVQDTTNRESTDIKKDMVKSKERMSEKRQGAIFNDQDSVIQSPPGLMESLPVKTERQGVALNASDSNASLDQQHADSRLILPDLAMNHVLNKTAYSLSEAVPTLALGEKLAIRNEKQQRFKRLRIRLTLWYVFQLVGNLCIGSLYLISQTPILHDYKTDLEEIAIMVGCLDIWFCLSLLNVFRNGLIKKTVAIKEPSHKHHSDADQDSWRQRIKHVFERKRPSHPAPPMSIITSLSQVSSGPEMSHMTSQRPHTESSYWAMSLDDK